MNSYVSHHQEVESGERFKFGANWMRFLKVLNDERIMIAEKSLISMLKRNSLEGLTFIDIGSGSGLFSLVARRLGAKVFSFDYDPSSCACTKELKRRYFPNDQNWHIEHGSVLDKDYLSKLGTFDIVYSWGVLHHTGSMWPALENIKPLVKPGGSLFIAIYNDLGEATDEWEKIKIRYNKLPSFLALLYALKIIAIDEFKTLKSYLRNEGFYAYLRLWIDYDKNSTRGMSKWHDWIDWVGGYPYERATIEQLVDFYANDGFRLTNIVSRRQGWGCNELVFERAAGSGVYVDSLIPWSTSLVRRYGRRVTRIENGQGTVNAPYWPQQKNWLFQNESLLCPITIDENGRFLLPENLLIHPEDNFYVLAGDTINSTTNFSHVRDNMWVWNIPELQAHSDSCDYPEHSHIYLLENGTALTPPHAIHDDIAKYGAGRFSHWGTDIYFSSFNNSDPNINKGTYSIFIPYIST